MELITLLHNYSFGALYGNKMRSKGIAVFVLGMMLLSSLPVLAANENGHDQISIRYSFEKPTVGKIIVKDTIYDNIALDDGACYGNPGDPSLPAKGAYILLPQGAKVESIQIVPGGKICLGSNYHIVPVGNAVPLVEGAHPPPPVAGPAYNSEKELPGKLYTNVGTYSFRGYDILVLRLYPVQYIPSTGELLYYPDITVNVKTSQTNDNQLYRGREKDRLEVLNKVDNPEILNTYDKNKLIKANQDQYDLLILTTNGLKNGFEPLKNAHEDKGLATEIKTLNDISLVPGSVTPEDIRDFIREEYTEYNIEYLLIGGDEDIIPTKMLYVSGYDEDTWFYDDIIPVDQYFGYLDGSFNYDGDDKWGEPNDGENGRDVDLFAEVYVGRACVDNMQDVNNFVQKTVAYLNMNAGDEYLSKVILAGEFLGEYETLNFGGDLNDALVDGSNRDGFTTVGIPSDKYNITKIYDRDRPGFDPNNGWETGWSATDLLQLVNKNIHILHHDGHSNYVYNMKMSNDYVSEFTNTKPFFAYSSGCMAGGFDYSGDDCFAEYMTVKTSNGAFAGIWNARYGFFWADRTDGDSSMYTRQFYDAIFGEKITTLGKTNQDSKEDNIYLLQRSMMRWTYYQLNLFGDPSVAFRVSEPPEKPTINGPSSGNAGETYSYTAVTTEPNGEQIYYKFSWGDGTESDWLGPFNSGESVKENHTWSSRGTFKIKVKAKDINGEESDWSDPLHVRMPKIYESIWQFIEKISEWFISLFGIDIMPFPFK